MAEGRPGVARVADTVEIQVILARVELEGAIVLGAGGGFEAGVREAVVVGIRARVAVVRQSVGIRIRDVPIRTVRQIGARQGADERIHRTAGAGWIGRSERALHEVRL
jgi:hypothetical protein